MISVYVPTLKLCLSIGFLFYSDLKSSRPRQVTLRGPRQDPRHQVWQQGLHLHPVRDGGGRQDGHREGAWDSVQREQDQGGRGQERKFMSCSHC